MYISINVEYYLYRYYSSSGQLKYEITGTLIVDEL